MVSFEMTQEIRYVAFYLPQFHPIPENDEWWGEGFTEWTNVTKARPLYAGHYQPHLPADLGFYDLRVVDTLKKQASLAKSYGISAFCYHYYWFSGKRLLDKPMQLMLDDPSIDMSFCICWANENWTRRWEGGDDKVLVKQSYSEQDELNFILDLLPVISDSRYLKIDGKPLIIVYRPQQIPNIQRAVNKWRAYCRSEGLGEIFICAALTHGNFTYSQFGFDGAVQFPPHNIGMSSRVAVSNVANGINFHKPFRGCVFDFGQVAQYSLAADSCESGTFFAVVPSWDNTARVNDRALILEGATPRNFEYWLKRASERTMEEFQGDARIVFINAWNEWAEGCHLEPDRVHGRGYLEAVKRVSGGKSRVSGFKSTGPIVNLDFENSFYADIRDVLITHSRKTLRRLAVVLKRYPRFRRFVRVVLRRERMFIR